MLPLFDKRGRSVVDGSRRKMSLDGHWIWYAGLSIAFIFHDVLKEEAVGMILLDSIFALVFTVMFFLRRRIVVSVSEKGVMVFYKGEQTFLGCGTKMAFEGFGNAKKWMMNLDRVPVEVTSRRFSGGESARIREFVGDEYFADEMAESSERKIREDEMVD